MNISISPKTQRLLQAQLKKGRHKSADAVVRHALETLGRVEGETYEQLDEETRAAIERAEAQASRGEGRPWKDVKAELRQRFLKN